MHTSASDGTWSPDELVREIIRAGIKIFSVTDHDSVENTEAVAHLAKEKDLTCIRGVEINTYREGMAFHILGYNIDIKNKNLNGVLVHNRSFFEKRNENSIEILAEAGLPVSPEEYRGYVNNPKRGGWKALNYLLDKNLCKNYKDFFGLFEGKKALLSMSGCVRPERAIAAVREAGGIPVLAHPGSGMYHSDYKKTLSAVLDMGIAGIECYHIENSEEVTEYSIGFCRENRLFITGGSDCHGDFVKERRLGKPDIDTNQLVLWDL